MKMLFNTLKETTIERIKSPLISSFSISWMIFNWRVIVFILLGKYDANELIIKIESYLNFYSSMLLPLITSVFYTLLYPLINYKVFNFLNILETEVELKRAENSIKVLTKKLSIASSQSKLNDYSLDFDKKMQIKESEKDYELAKKQNELEEMRIEIEELRARNQIDEKN